MSDGHCTLLAPLLNTLLLAEDEVTHNLWKNSRWPAILLREAL